MKTKSIRYFGGIALGTFLALVCMTLVVSAQQCGQLVVEPQPTPGAVYSIDSWMFASTDLNGITSNICGHVPYNITETDFGMQLEVNVTGADVILEVYADVNLTFQDGTLRPYHMTHLQYFQQGITPIHLNSYEQFNVGTYDVIAVGARRI